MNATLAPQNTCFLCQSGDNVLHLRGCNHSLCSPCKEIMLQHDTMCMFDHGFARIQCPQCNEFEALSDEALEKIRQDAWNESLIAFSMYVSSQSLSHHDDDDEEASTDEDTGDDVDRMLNELTQDVEMRWRPWLDIKYTHDA